ncbi:oligosaccharide flippase family protein [Brevibacillus sp. NRS-1366]|uniref:oligosaccharide flippase family protein n=1 Tax=Brevibacillus sp. NRS-1366 TaxID=3233899 RepID=UPI003D209BA9
MYLPQLLKDFLLRSVMLTIVKLIGALGRIFLFRLLGSEGIGLYQMAYAYYGLMITVITGGFASGVSLETAKNIQTGKKWFHFSLFLLMVLGVFMGLLSYFYAPLIAKLFGKIELVRPIQFLAPAILLVPVLSLMRGFLQGIQRYGYIAMSELIEQVVRVSAMVIFASLLMQKGLSEAVGGALLGAVLGALIAFLFLLVPLSSSFPNVNLHTNEQPESPSIPVFIMSCIAIMGTRIILPVTDFIDSLLVPNRLVFAGYSVQEATRIYGEFFGMAATVVFVPTLITSSLSHIIMPRLTIAWETYNTAEFMNKIKVTFNTALLWGLCSALLLAVYSNLISTLVIGNESLASTIRALSLIPFLTGLRECSTTVLWTMDVKKKPLIGLILATIISSIINFILIGIPGYSFVGIALGILSFEIISLLYNLLILMQALYPRTKRKK